MNHHFSAKSFLLYIFTKCYKC